MPNKVKVLCDTSCDLPAQLAESRGILVLPALVIFNSELFREGVDISVDAFYDRLQQGLVPSTSQIGPADFAPFFRAAVADGSEAVYIGLSSGLSGSTGNAEQVAAELGGGVRVVDSLSASMGAGLMVLKAADLADEGLSADAIVAELIRYREQVCHAFTLDTLEFARRSGRITRLSAIAAGVLDIKPVLNIDMEGRLEPLDKVRGRKRALNRVCDEIDRLGADLHGKRAALSHAHDRETAAALAERLRTEYGAAEVVVGEIGANIGSHVGPGCIAIFFEGPAGRGYAPQS
ncbi:MAG: DegV family protein [Mycobacterium leprae]